MMAGGYTPPRRLDVALLATAVEAHDAHVDRQRDRCSTPPSAAARGRPRDVAPGRRACRCRRTAARGPTRAARYRVVLDDVAGAGGTAVDVDVERSGRFERRITVGSQSFAVLS